MKIIKQEMIRSANDLCKLRIIDWHRTNGLWENNPLIPIEIAGNLLSNNVLCTIIECDLTDFPNRNDWPNWKHSGNGFHEHIGQMYWNMFQETYAQEGGTLHFADSPDFSGTIPLKDGSSQHFYGDIGQVSASTFVVDVLRATSQNDLWITLRDERTQIILEFLQNTGLIIGEAIAQVFSLD